MFSTKSCKATVRFKQEGGEVAGNSLISCFKLPAVMEILSGRKESVWKHLTSVVPQCFDSNENFLF